MDSTFLKEEIAEPSAKFAQQVDFGEKVSEKRVLKTLQPSKPLEVGGYVKYCGCGKHQESFIQNQAVQMAMSAEMESIRD